MLLLGPRLSLVVEQQVRRVVSSAVSHHHRANGAGVDVLDLEEALDHVDVFRLDVLKRSRASCILLINKQIWNRQHTGFFNNLELEQGTPTVFLSNMSNVQCA